jgi:SAM-dependent methyltransferase
MRLARNEGRPCLNRQISSAPPLALLSSLMSFGMVEQLNALFCGICGGTEFSDRRVLWPGLIAEWQISPVEVDYVDRQQGTTCNKCGSNLRSVALANAIGAHLQDKSPLQEIAARGTSSHILEINEAGSLSPILRRFSSHVLAVYPEVDIHRLPYADGSFDLVIHSDTLEHVDNPIHALAECRRVLRPGGALCFTIPIIVGRMSRNRAGLAKSHHGNPAAPSDDFAVRTEFGADAWTYLMEAGFSTISIHAVGYPAATAFRALKI